MCGVQERPCVDLQKQATCTVTSYPTYTFMSALVIFIQKSIMTTNCLRNKGEGKLLESLCNICT
jgi:hypothetical protein